MFSDDDEDDLDMLNLVINVANMQRERRYWIHPLWLDKGKSSGAFNVMRELNMYPERFQSFYRMSIDCFYRILTLVRDDLTKKNTNWREPVSPEERLLITLR